jgi:hypothetical protein
MAPPPPATPTLFRPAGWCREILDTVRGNRQFLVRAVRFLRDAGIGQFIDIGSGLPSSPNVHEIAQAGDTGARVVYVDNDPVVSVHAEALMAQNHTTAVVRSGLRDVDEVLSQGRGTAGLHPAGRAAVRRVPAPHRGFRRPGRRRGPVSGGARARQLPGHLACHRWALAGKDAVLRLFNGRELVDPGLVLVSYWRPDGGEPGPNADRAWAYGGVAVV